MKVPKPFTSQWDRQIDPVALEYFTTVFETLLPVFRSVYASTNNGSTNSISDFQGWLTYIASDVYQNSLN